jgi:hypothetical protein
MTVTRTWYASSVIPVEKGCASKYPEDWRDRVQDAVQVGG